MKAIHCKAVTRTLCCLQAVCNWWESCYMLMSTAIKAQHQSRWNNKYETTIGNEKSKWNMWKRKRGPESRDHNTAPSLGQISPDLSVYQNPVSELYVSPSWHHHVPWLIEPQFPQRLAAFQLTRPSQSLTTEGLVRPRKGNSSSLSLLATSLGSSCILIGDSLDPSLTLIGFSVFWGARNGNWWWRWGRGSKTVEGQIEAQEKPVVYVRCAFSWNASGVTMTSLWSGCRQKALWPLLSVFVSCVPFAVL